MSLSVSARVSRVKPSATGAVLAKASELRRQGQDIINLGTGEPDFDTPAHIADAAIAAIRRGDTRYTPIDGTPELKAAICERFRADQGIEFDSANVIVSSGAKQSIFNLCMALLGPGDEAIVQTPYWVSYPEIVALGGARAVFVPTTISSGFKMTAQELEAQLTSKTRLVILNSPSNPTGAAYTRRELESFGRVLEKWPNVVVVADDIYDRIYWAGDSCIGFAAACPSLRDRTVSVNGVSKAYAMTGWRVGYAAGPETLVKAMNVIQSQSTSNACTVSQAAAVAALTGDQAPVSAMTAAYHARHDRFVSGLNELEGVDCNAADGAFYAFPNVVGAISHLGLTSSVELAEALIERTGVASVPGEPFGAPGHLRFSFACSEAELDDALARIKRLLAA